MRTILAVDQGTTSSRAMLFDHSGAIVATAQAEFAQHCPQPGWVEHDALEIWAAQLKVAQECLKKASNRPVAQSNHARPASESIAKTQLEIAAIGIANQRETTLLWDPSTGQPLHNAIVWQDRRTAGRCDELRDLAHADVVQQKTGLVLDAYFLATKLAWARPTGTRMRAARCWGSRAAPVGRTSPALR